MRLIKSDAELQTILDVLLMEMKDKATEGENIFFPPETFVIPDEEIRKRQMTVKNADERIYNFNSFKYETVKTNTSFPEALRLLGVTLYYLATGSSEFNDESILLDGYGPLDSTMWPTTAFMMSGQAADIKVVENMANGIKPEEMKQSIETTAGKTSLSGARKATDEYLAYLANQGLQIIRADEVAPAWGIDIPSGLSSAITNQALMKSARKTANKNNNGRWHIIPVSLSVR